VPDGRYGAPPFPFPFFFPATIELEELAASKARQHPGRPSFPSSSPPFSFFGHSEIGKMSLGINLRGDVVNSLFPSFLFVFSPRL